MQSSRVYRKTIKISHHSIALYYSKAWRSALSLQQKKVNRKRLQIHLDKTLRQHKDTCNFSISHCPELGCYALCASSAIGIDVESRKRIISPRAYKRIATQSEQKLDIPAIVLWTFKESSWKALKGGQQPLTALDITIVSCTKKAGRFRWQKNSHPPTSPTGHGRFIHALGCVMSLAIK